MNCEKCQDRGFIEENHGLIVIACDCEAGKRYKARMQELLRIPKEEIDVSNSGTEPDNQSIGSGDTSEPEQPKKQRAKKKARKRAR